MRFFDTTDTTIETRRIIWKAYREAIDAARTRKGKKTEDEIAGEKNMEQFMKKIVVPQLKDGWKLDLSDNEAIGRKLGMTSRQAQRTKEQLSKRGILFVPEFARQKKKGDYPIWLINRALVKVSVVEGSEKKRVVRPVEQRYTQEFCKRFYYPVLQEVREMFEQEEKETGKEVVVSKQMYWTIVNTWINQELEAEGYARDDFRL